MKRVQTWMTGLSVIALGAALATPTLAAKTVFSDEELDQVTAAGQPKIAQASVENGAAVALNFQDNMFDVEFKGQENLTALTLNNIFGENQIANGMNIQSGADNEGNQINDIIQSWGSAQAFDSVVVEGVDGGDGGGVGPCNGIIAICTAGDGGDGSQGTIGLQWAFADEIANAYSGNGPATSSNMVMTTMTVSFDQFAQSGLRALVVNNIVGFNQVANGLNISSGSIIGTDINGAGVGSATNQTNTIEQWRGAPKGWSEAPTFF